MDSDWLNHNATWVKSRRHYVLSIFNFPLDKLDIVEHGTAPVGAPLRAEDLEVHDAFRCRVCGLTFEDVAGMRTHFKSASHVAQLAGGPKSTGENVAVLAEGYEHLCVGRDTESESDSSSEDGSAADTNPVFLSNPTAQYHLYEMGPVRKTYNAQEGPRVVFRRSTWNNFEFSVSNAVLDNFADTDEESRVQSPWSSITRALHTYSVNPMWFIVSLRSGRFAAAIFDGPTTVCHKAFRR